MTAAMGSLYAELIEKQVRMWTGAIIGVSEEEKQKIDLLYNYIEKGLFISTNGQEEYWKYKLSQTEIRSHPFDDTIFKLLYI